MTAILWALGASFGWGTADFLAGMQARRSPVVVVVLVSSTVGMVGVGAFVALRGIGPPEGRQLVAAIVVGIVGVISVFCFYRALALGAMSVVAPIAATSAAIPVLYGVIEGERPAALQWVGMVVRSSAARWRRGRARRGCTPRTGGCRSCSRCARCSASACSWSSVGIASEHDPLWTILISRAVVVAVFGVAALVTRPAFGEGGAARPARHRRARCRRQRVLRRSPRPPGLLGIVVGDRLDLPGHHRRARRTGASASASAARQRAGVVLALTGVVLITARV